MKNAQAVAVLASLGSAFVLSMAAVPTSSASPEPGPPPGISDAIWEDSQRYAQSSGGDAEAIAREAAFQAEANAIIDPLIAKHTAVYSTAEFPGDGTIRVHFVGEVPSDIVDAVSGDPRFVLVGGAALSEEQAADLNAGVFAETSKHLPMDAQSMSVVDPIDGSVQVVVTDVSAARAAEAGIVNVMATVTVDPTLDIDIETSDGGDTLVTWNTRVFHARLP